MTFHLHIKGRVQGVGFRPYIHRSAAGKNITGNVSNDTDGLHVIFNSPSSAEAAIFAKEIIQNGPSKAIIQTWSLTQVEEQSFNGFSILIRESGEEPDLLISPDFSICTECKNEFHNPGNRRHKYPFITCTLCGPRFSIMDQLPYERYLTSMKKFSQCNECDEEYNDVSDRRYFSQTNSCTVCGIHLTWHRRNGDVILRDTAQILSEMSLALGEGKIIAVKGIGGFLLLCDAGNKEAIRTLRARKHRPKKPFAVLLPGIEMVHQYAYANPQAIEALLDEVSPIVLLQAKEACFEELDMAGISPGLSTIGVMLPYAPLLEWIISTYKYPLIATSGNVSGSSIIFRSGDKEQLFEYADFILDHNRDIVVPQDDSVVKFAEESNQRVILRRSRGMAPSIILPPALIGAETIFAAGAMLKSTFGIQHNHQIYISQFLGNLESYEAQQNYLCTFDHFLQLVKARPQVILADLHPGYPSTQIAAEYSMQRNLPFKKIQHHEAHFAAILGEYDLFASAEKILGIIWDGTGLGSDGNTWGGEFFIYEKGKMERVHFLEPFPNIAGDKMAKEPRLAALAIAGSIDEASPVLQSMFSKQEWDYYQKVIKRQDLKNTSAGRYFDGVASLLGLVNINTYEGEAALMLEQCAYTHLNKRNFEIEGHYFHEEIDQQAIPMKQVIKDIIHDVKIGKGNDEISAKFHLTVAAIVEKVIRKLGVKKVAFSGGVFQNTVLIDLLLMPPKKRVYLEDENILKFYFHRQMPPNDECISFGQLMHYQNIKT